MERPLFSRAVMIIEQFAHLLFSPFANSLPSIVPMPLIIISASGLRFGQSFVFLPAIVELVDCSLAAMSTIAALPAPLSALLQLTVPIMRKSPDPFFLVKGLPPMSCLLSLPNKLLHTVTVFSGHWRGQIPPSKLHCP